MLLDEVFSYSGQSYHVPSQFTDVGIFSLSSFPPVMLTTTEDHSRQSKRSGIPCFHMETG